MVLQVARPPARPPRQARRADLDAAVKAPSTPSHGHLRVAAGARRPRRGRLEGDREHGRRVDGPPGLAGPQAQAAPGIDSPGPIRAEVPRPGAPRLHRRGTEREVVRGHHRDPHRLDSWGRCNALMEKRSWRCLMDWWIGRVCRDIRLVSGRCSFGCWIVGARFGRRRWVPGSAPDTGYRWRRQLGWPADARGPGSTPHRRRPSSSGCLASGATFCGGPRTRVCADYLLQMGLIRRGYSPARTSAISVWSAPTALAGARSEPMLGPFVDDSRHITATGPCGLVKMHRRPGLTPSALPRDGSAGPTPSTSALTGIASRISLSPFRKPRALYTAARQEEVRRSLLAVAPWPRR